MSAKDAIGRLEFRAARLAEIWSIDLDAPEIVLPTMLYLSPSEWAATMKGLEMHGATQIRGSGVMVAPATADGDVILSGRDPFGRPAVPVPVDDGTIEFVSMARIVVSGEPVDPNVPHRPIEKVGIPEVGDTPRPPPVPEACKMSFKKRDDGGLEPVCSSPDCGRCLLMGYTGGTFGWISCTCLDMIAIGRVPIIQRP